MRCVLLSLIQLASALPLPIARDGMLQTSNNQPSIQVVEFNLQNGYSKLGIIPGFKHNQDAQLISPLVLELSVNPAKDALHTDIDINDQQLDVRWEENFDKGAFFATVASPSTQVLSIRDQSNFSHLVDISVSGYIATNWSHPSSPEPEDKQHLSLRILSVDQLAVKHLDLGIVSRPEASKYRLVKVFSTLDMQPGGDELQRIIQPHTTFTKTQLDANPDQQLYHGSKPGGVDIGAEIESLLLLEAEAGDLDARIQAQKQVITKSLRDHRDQASLAHLLEECDGVVCAAKVIAQRICDKVGIETEPNFDYVKVQNPSQQNLIQLDGKDNASSAAQSGRPSNMTVPNHQYLNLHTSGAAVRQSMEIAYPQSLLYKVLGCVATAFGLTALFAFIRRRCMSARRRVERLAEQEERRNARAYRRAARRADIRKRWAAFIAALNCFKYSSEPVQIEHYEEKRALILQDAFMEQDVEAAEKGEVMEAEIRELRHAHEIVASLVRVDEQRYDLRSPFATMASNPPLIPLPSGRSRASTATLPSYTSGSLPEYQSRISTASTDVPSSGSSVFDSEYCSPGATNSTEEEAMFTIETTGSDPRSCSPEGSSNTRDSRFTEISSVLALSPRASEETLRTIPRSSLAWSRRSRDTNDL